MLKVTLSRCLNVIPSLALTFVFCWAAWERFRLPLTPFADPDVLAYLAPALNALVGDRFREWSGQCFLYPGFLYIVLRSTGNFRCITLVQGLIGLSTGGLLFGCWMEFRRLLPAPRLPLWIFKVLGAELVAVYLLSPATIEFERMLRPEALFPCVVILQVYCNLRFIRARFLDRAHGFLFSGALAVFLSVAASLLKPSFSGALLFANLPMIISLFRPGPLIWVRVLSLAAPLTAAVLLLIWPECHLRRLDPAGSRYLSQSLFSVHADLINKQMSEDVARGAVTPYSPDFLANTQAALAEALRQSRQDGKHWPALGFNGDYVRFGGPGKTPFLSELTLRFGDEDRSSEFCRYYYWRAVRGQPGGMAAKIARQFAVFYSPRFCPAYFTYGSLNVGDRYKETVSSMENQPNLPRYLPATSMLASAAALSDSRLWIGPFKLIPRINLLLARAHLCLCLWAGSLAILTWSMSNLFSFRMVSGFLLLLYGYNFGTVLTLAIGHSLDVGRYSQYQFAYTVLPDFVSFWLLIEVFILAADYKKHRRTLASRAEPRPTP